MHALPIICITDYMVNQAAIERKTRAKAKKAQQLEADKKGQTHDDMLARFKSDLQVHEAVGDRRVPGKMGAFHAWHNTTVCFHIIRNLETMHD